MQGGSAVPYSRASSSSQAYSTQPAAITASSTSLYGSGSSSDPPVTGSTSRASSSRLRPDNEGVREPHYRPQAPHVLLPPAAPPPPAGPNDESFSRAPPRNLSYDPFPPAVLYARGNDLIHDGFPLEPPACSCAPQPHPFITHDVNEDDWTRFLRDVKGAGGLTPVDSMIADVAPRAVKTGLLIGFIADMALRAHVEGKKKNPVADLIADWNKCFFHPRLMEVTLAQGARVDYSRDLQASAKEKWRMILTYKPRAV
ncbi:hypothetical protein L226DRAFT_467373 [Lentinus tigrinus ALCF2SS1-7]|uniref:uncharacterized protein n=1 Tax=Lentinus tigrinus ALCF2SS1-7 TaxID=1328758 RepID=UPI0011663979|nr:hypothetical protein L226DRAFT_467373 [Lentinus tigrinus ALCF2SS1-7]